MRFAREGVPFIAVATVLAAGAVWGAAAAPTPVRVTLAAIVALVALWVAYFFRDPERDGPRGDALVISPADGKVVHVTDVHEPAFLRGPSKRISVFMNVFSVHVNRYPVSGTVRYVHYNPGKFLNAAVEKASLENEQSSVGIEAPIGRVLVRQIAGLVARRIVTYSRDGDAAAQGARFGIIRFGSRVDVFVPADAAVKVRVGDHVSAGVTVLAER
ncbi:MAG: phosphatidylserine decarboxylase family protein [Gemmatimonadota bacterium]|nr:phosphatidylserine decarboxylase family protein [Gemmatimonadota bacterium]